MKLSVIVPVYNVESYLAKCLDSIVSQTYRDLEIIVVNDGSTDHSPALIAEFAEKDSRIVAVNKQNGGLSSARNAGLDLMTGDYVTFVDSDDYLAPDTFEKNLTFIAKNPSTDLLFFPVTAVFEDGRPPAPYHTYPKTAAYPYNHRTVDELFYGYFFLVCGGFFRKTIFEKLRFPDGLIYEDTWIIPEVSRQVKTMAISNKGEYFYLQRENSITHDFMSERKFVMNLNATRNAYNCYYNEMSRYTSEQMLYRELKYIRMMMSEIPPSGKKWNYYGHILVFILKGNFFRFFDWRAWRFLFRKRRKKD